MKKLARLFLLAAVWLSILWLSYAQDWNDSIYNTNVIASSKCQCATQPISPFAVYCLIWILILSIFIMPSRWIFKKAWQKPWKSWVLIWNFYSLFGVATSKFWQSLSFLVIILLFWIFIYGKFIYPSSSYSHCCNWDRIIQMNLWIFALFLCIFIIQFYCLARKFGLKLFYSICLALFFPIWVRILSFGNYEYIGNKENTKNLELK